MDLFEWIKDIEKVYEDLINNAKEINLNDIEEFRDQYRKRLEFFIDEKNELINNALISLSIEVDKETKVFEEQMDNALKHIKNQFQKEIKNLQELIIVEVGLDF